MTTSAACGRPVQQAALTETMLEVPTLSTTTKPTFFSSSTWWEQVRLADRPAPRPGHRCAWHPVGEVDSACSSRTGCGSASSANHSA